MYFDKFDVSIGVSLWYFSDIPVLPVHRHANAKPADIEPVLSTTVTTILVFSGNTNDVVSGISTVPTVKVMLPLYTKVCADIGTQSVLPGHSPS